MSQGWDGVPGSVEPLPPLFLEFSHTRDHLNQPPTATDCQSFVSRLASLDCGQSGDAGASWFDNDERTSNAVTEFVADRTSRIPWKPNQDDSGGFLPARICEEPEVFVFRQQDSLLRTGERENGRILRASSDLYNGGNFVAGRTESCDYAEIAALIGEKTHLLISASGLGSVDEDDLFMRECIGCISHRRLNVLARQLG
jgi:hypothetical protein